MIGVSLALSLHGKNKGGISWRAVFRGFLPVVRFLHSAFGVCFPEKTLGNHRTEEILVSWELRGERWDIWGREEICRQETVYALTEHSTLACSASATVVFFSCRPPQLGYLVESEKNKLNFRDHLKIMLLGTSSQLCNNKYPAQMQDNIFKYSVLLKCLCLSSSFLSFSPKWVWEVLALTDCRGWQFPSTQCYHLSASARLLEPLTRGQLQGWKVLSPEVLSRHAAGYMFPLL